MERDRGTEDRAPRKRTRDGASSSGARPPSCDAAPAPAAPPASRAKIATSISMAKRSHPPPMSNLSLAASLGNHGIIMLLFETPSGFAIFSFHGVALLLPDAIENIWADFGRKYRANCVWLKEFRFFEDKSAAINPETGVSDELREMLMKWCSPGYKLAVGKSEYKTIIEDKLKIPCLHSDAVMEVMWGLKNLMHSLVPEEKSHLSKEDRLQMSQGLEMLLKRYGVDVKPEMVSDRIIGLACLLYDCDCMDNVHFASLRDGGRILKDVSGIDTCGWGPIKLATALKMVCYPGEEIVACDPAEMFSEDVLLKLKEDAHKYKGKMYGGICLKIYNELLASDKLRTVKVKQLRSSVKEAEKAYQTDQDALSTLRARCSSCNLFGRLMCMIVKRFTVFVVLNYVELGEYRLVRMPRLVTLWQSC